MQCVQRHRTTEDRICWHSATNAVSKRFVVVVIVISTYHIVEKAAVKVANLGYNQET